MKKKDIEKNVKELCLKYGEQSEFFDPIHRSLTGLDIEILRLESHPFQLLYVAQYFSQDHDLIQKKHTDLIIQIQHEFHCVFDARKGTIIKNELDYFKFRSFSKFYYEMINLCPIKMEKDVIPRNHDGLDSLKVITNKHLIPPGHYTDNYSSIASTNGKIGLKEIARGCFEGDDELPEYIYMPEIKQIKVKNTRVLYATIMGVYSH